ncbi:MAG: 1-phosphofructokinase family hexose kinase [Anaerolineales bacterium]
MTVTIHPALDKIVRLRRLLPNDAARARIEMVYGGGKGNNVARALKRLGTPVLATGFQGGYTGEMLIHQFADEDIPTSYIACAAPTRTSLMIIEEETGNTYSIYEPGQTVTLQEIDTFRNHFDHLLEQISLVLFCGSGQTPELAHLFGDLIRMAQARGIRCGLDSSGLALREGVAVRPYLLKVNRDELSELVNRPLITETQQMQAMLDLNRQGIQLVALTRGSEGLLITNGETFLIGELPMSNVINVMGCGDSLLAGMASVLLEGGSLEHMVRRGVACGAANTQVVGAGFIDRSLVHELESKVTLRQVEPNQVKI